MKTPVYVLSNNSHQPVSVNYQVSPGLATGTASAVEGAPPPTNHGLLTIAPGTKVVIEQSRVNFGQIHNLAAQNLITMAQSYL